MIRGHFFQEGQQGHLAVVEFGTIADLVASGGGGGVERPHAGERKREAAAQGGGRKGGVDVLGVDRTFQQYVVF